MLELKRLTKNLFSHSLANVIRVFLGAAIMILLARRLCLEDFGRLSFALSFVAFFAVFVDSGLNAFSVVRISQDRETAAQLITDILPLKFLLALVAFAFICISINLLGYPPLVRAVTYLFGLSVLMDSFLDFMCSTFRGREKMHYEAIVAFLQYSVLFLYIFFLGREGTPLSLVAMAWLLSRALALLITIGIWRKVFAGIRIVFDFSSWGVIFKNSFFFGLLILLSSIYTKINMVILSKVKGDAEVGYFQIALNIMMLAVFALDNLSNVFLPFISRKSRELQHDFGKLIYRFNKAVFFILIPAVFFVYVFAQEIIRFCYGQTWSYAVILLRLLALAYLLQYAPPSATVFLAIDRPRICFGVALAGAALSLVMNIVLIPVYGAGGAAVVLILSYFLVRSLYVWIYHKFSFTIFDTSYLKIVLVSAFLSVLTYWMRTPFFVLTAVTYICGYLVFSYIFVLKEEERRVCADLVVGFFPRRYEGEKK